jgi:hypothetical protein
MPEALTPMQKLHALSHRFYSGRGWAVTVGDYYTTSRADLELYKVVKIEDGKVFTTYLPEGGPLAEWTFVGFTTDGFGPNRVYVPQWIFDKVK